MVKIISGSSNPELASEIARYVGVKLTPTKLSSFRDGEYYIQILETVRGSDVFIIQGTSKPVNDNLMELLLLIDAAKRASANSVCAVIPYYGYSRQDRKANPREPISAKLVANLVQNAGADRVMTVDLHSIQQQGFFDVPMDNLWAAPLFKSYFSGMDNLVVISPDAGGAGRARHLGKLLNSPIAIIDKRRVDHNKSEVMNILGSVKDKTCIIYDDMIDTGGTICMAIDAVMEAGAKEVHVCSTHGVLSDGAMNRLNSSVAKEIVVTNTIPVRNKGRVKVISIDALIGEAIKKISNKESLSTLSDANFQTRLVSRAKRKRGK